MQAVDAMFIKGRRGHVRRRTSLCLALRLHSSLVGHLTACRRVRAPSTRLREGKTWNGAQFPSAGPGRHSGEGLAATSITGKPPQTCRNGGAALIREPGYGCEWEGRKWQGNGFQTEALPSPKQKMKCVSVLLEAEAAVTAARPHVETTACTHLPNSCPLAHVVTHTLTSLKCNHSQLRHTSRAKRIPAHPCV